MDKRSKILLMALLLLTIISIYLTYRRSFITKDYEIIADSDVLGEVQ
jgi:hypothetical protein